MCLRRRTGLAQAASAGGRLGANLCHTDHGATNRFAPSLPGRPEGNRRLGEAPLPPRVFCSAKMLMDFALAGTASRVQYPPLPRTLCSASVLTSERQAGLPVVVQPARRRRPSLCSFLAHTHVLSDWADWCREHPLQDAAGMSDHRKPRPTAAKSPARVRTYVWTAN